MKHLLLILLTTAWSVAATAAERPVTLERDFGTLHGTLLTPDAGSEIVALIIAGSGPTDRNGNSPMGVNTNMYLYLAQALEQAGIASLRYDKRMIGASTPDDPALSSEEVLTFDNYIDDAAALADWLSAQGFRKVVLVGHSEGAQIAFVAAQQSKAVSAVVSVAGPGYPMDEILQGQLAAQLAPNNMELLMQANHVIASLKQGKSVADVPPMLASLFRPSIQPYLISVFRNDPRKEIRKLTVPVLIVGGDNDLQISIDNAEKLAEAQPEALKIIIPRMTHALKASDESTLPGQMMTVYTDSTLSLAPGFTETVTEFIRAL